MSDEKEGREESVVNERKGMWWVWIRWLHACSDDPGPSWFLFGNSSQYGIVTIELSDFKGFYGSISS